MDRAEIQQLAEQGLLEKLREELPEMLDVMMLADTGIIRLTVEIFLEDPGRNGVHIDIVTPSLVAN